MFAEYLIFGHRCSGKKEFFHFANTELQMQSYMVLFTNSNLEYHVTGGYNLSQLNHTSSFSNLWNEYLEPVFGHANNTWLITFLGVLTSSM